MNDQRLEDWARGRYREREFQKLLRRIRRANPEYQGYTLTELQLEILPDDCQGFDACIIEDLLQRHGF